MSKGKTAVVMAWRQGEDDLAATVEDAGRSVGKSALVFPVEDKTGAGPAQTRHRGIVAARDAGADVACITDAHMRFDGDVIARMARQVRRGGGLLCPKCYHNPECSFDAKHPSGASYYAGADIHYKGIDQSGHQALLWKWSSNTEPGPRACIGGACYVFPVEWYFRVGEPLAALPAWGCDEEALSISAWLSGAQPTVFDGKVAHRWRPRPPWKTAANPLWTSRAAMISAVAADPADRADLIAWQGCAPIPASAEVERWRSAMLKQPRTWAQWKMTVPILTVPGALMNQHVKNVTGKPHVRNPVAPVARPASAGIANYGAAENKRTCLACGSAASIVESMRTVHRLIVRYRICKGCGARRSTTEVIELAAGRKQAADSSEPTKGSPMT